AVREYTDGGRLPVARIEPPRSNPAGLDDTRAHGEAAAHRRVDHRIRTVDVAGPDESIPSRAGHAGRHSPADDDAVVRNAGEERPGLEQGAGVLHLGRAR